MNTQQFHTKVREQLMEENTPEYDLLTDDMIDIALNSTSVEYVRDELNPEAGKPFGNVPKLAGIHTLQRSIGIALPEEGQPLEEYHIDVPDDMMEPLPSYATTMRVVPGVDVDLNNKKLQQKAEIVFQAQADVFNIQDNPFTRTGLKRINALLEQNLITLKVNKKSIVIDISLKYICIPNKISLLLYKQDATQGLCDLPKGVHNLIAERAVRYLLEQFQSQRQQKR